jgi:alpha-mannosidase
MDDRIVQKKLQILQDLSIEDSYPMDAWQARTAEFSGPETYTNETEWKTIPAISRWPADRTIFIRGSVRVPDVPLAKTYLEFGFTDLEGLLSIEGRPYAGIDWAHRRVPVPGRGKLNLHLEFTFIPRSLYQTENQNKSGIFEGGRIIVVNSEINEAFYDIRFAWEASRVTVDPRRKRLLEEAVEESLLAIDLTLPRETLMKEVNRGKAILRQKVEKIGPDPEAGSIFLAGHTHIDTAWLWPIKETIRKCGRTFSTACRLMEQFPDFSFSCSQAQLYEYTKRYFPTVYREMKKWIKLGRWETTGAMWVEADCNVASGESLIRQILYGLNFFREEFGTRPKTCWLPDVFGYPASLPEILKGCGVEFFLTCKLHWQAQNPFPYHLFRWRGLDGSEVISHIPKLKDYYNGIPNPEQLSIAWNNYLQKAEYPEVMLPYGYGDGGGGATEEMLELLERSNGNDFPGLPKTRTGPSEKYFNDVVKKKPKLPVWDGELYLETHRGTYTSQGPTKRANRKSELALREAEIFGAFANIGGKKVNLKDLKNAWQITLLHQFHDILPGSSIGMVYEETLSDLTKVRETVGSIIDNALTGLVPGKPEKSPDAVCVFNSLSWPRNDMVTATVPAAGKDLCVCSPAGEPLKTQVIERGKGKTTIAFQPGEIPSMGYSVFTLCNQKVNSISSLKVSKNKIENSFYCIELTPDGGISKLVDKRFNREVVPAGTVANDLQLFQDGPEPEDAWNVHPTFDKRRYPFEGKTVIEIVERGPVRAVLRVKRTHRTSSFIQDIVVYDNSPRIDFVTKVDWQERQTILKVAFPLEIRALNATYEVQFGAVERPTHQNTSWDQSKFEVSGHRWADLSEAGYGVSLLNDCKYGFDARENVLRLTLLRSTIFPDPNADLCHHEFTYSLLPHDGDWRQGQTVQEAWQLNVPARTVAVSLQKNPSGSKSFVSVSGAAAIVETFKPAENGEGYILRLYEPHGGRGVVTVNCDLPVKKVIECNLVEEDQKPVKPTGGIFDFPIKPYQIRTFRLVLG